MEKQVVIVGMHKFVLIKPSKQVVVFPQISLIEFITIDLIVPNFYNLSSVTLFRIM